MTVTYLKDSRIEVEDPHDALLLRLAGILLYDWQGKHAFFDAKDELERADEYCKINFTAVFPVQKNQYMPERRLYVPADVARLLVTNTSDGGIGWDYLYASMIADGDILRFESWDDEEYIYMRRHNDRWNLLPEIEMEK